MPINRSLIAELEREAATTRRVLERVPEDKLTWKPHWKSMSLGTLALHIARIPGGLADFLNEPVREAPNFAAPEAASRDEILSTLEKSVATARERLSSWTDEDLKTDWTLTRGGATLFVQPRGDVSRTLMFNHWYHHRGELVVYLRLLDVPVPSVYGPSADENPFAIDKQ
jgi:uncharacterized damage-inducible protein DinB